MQAHDQSHGIEVRPHRPQLSALECAADRGAAPALIAYTWALKRPRDVGLDRAFIYCACEGIRLARYRVKSVLPEE